MVGENSDWLHCTLRHSRLSLITNPWSIFHLNMLPLILLMHSTDLRFFCQAASLFFGIALSLTHTVHVLSSSPTLWGGFYHVVLHFIQWDTQQYNKLPARWRHLQTQREHVISKRSTSCMNRYALKVAALFSNRQTRAPQQGRGRQNELRSTVQLT